MITARNIGNQSWIDVSSPTKEDIDTLMLSYSIDPSAARDLLSPTPRQQSRELAESFYAVIHLPIFSKEQAESEHQEIDCVITENSLVTVRYDSIDALHYFAKQVEADEILSRNEDTHPLFGLMKEIYKHLGHELTSIEGWLRDIEHKIFLGQEKEMVISISAVARHLLAFRRIVAPHLEVWQSLHNQSEQKFGHEFAREASALLGDIKRLLATAENLTEMVSELRETNNSMLSTKQNEIMKVLTIMAFVTFPLSLIAAIFGMNTSFIPIVGWPQDFWIVMGIMLSATLAMFTFFRYKKWI